MFSKIVKGVARSGVEFAESAGELFGGITDLAGGWQKGDPIDPAVVRKMVGAGFNMAQIATFFGVAERVIDEVLKEDEGEKTEDK